MCIIVKVSKNLCCTILSHKVKNVDFCFLRYRDADLFCRFSLRIGNQTNPKMRNIIPIDKNAGPSMLQVFLVICAKNRPVVMEPRIKNAPPTDMTMIGL